MKRIPSLFKISLSLLAMVLSIPEALAADISGSPVKWHKTIISFAGPETHELALPNPFTDYRLDVLFSGPSGQEYRVPGYYAADGNAAETSADSGSIWQVNFCPDEAGTWTFQASFVSGENIAAELEGGISAGYFDGESGTFEVSANEDTDPKDFRNKGKLVYTGEHFLRFSETGDYFLKTGANSPEVFLEYAEFDNTPTARLYPDHVADWSEGDPVWQEEKGKGIVGVVNYLSSVGINAFYFLTMNAYGDGKKAWPWIHQDSMVRYDCSKLDQWDIVFEHMNASGIMVHMVLTETENESYFEVLEHGEPGGFADSRKIYYREMVARYGYLPAITWNVGEENGWHSNASFEQANTDEQRKEACDRLRELTYYLDHISIHNGPSWDEHIFEALLGHESHTGPAYQWDNSKQIYKKILEWRKRSAEAGHPWVVSFDEPYVNPEFIGTTKWRRDNVWPTFMAGGAGIELYVGAGLDLRIQNMRKYEEYYQIMTLAAGFFRSEVAFDQMIPDEQVTGQGFALNQQDSLFLVFFPDASGKTVRLPEGSYELHWFDPRTGGEIQQGQVTQLSGGQEVHLGMAPSDPAMDWLCVIRKRSDFQEELALVQSPAQRIFEEGKAQLDRQDSIILTASSGFSSGIQYQVSDTALLRLVALEPSDDIHTYLLALADSVNTLPPGEYGFLIAFNADEAPSLLVPYSVKIEKAPSTVSIGKVEAFPLGLRSNICRNELEITGSVSGTIEARIMNLNGMLMGQHRLREHAGKRIDIGSLQKGIYLISLETSRGSAAYRFIKI